MRRRAVIAVSLIGFFPGCSGFGHRDSAPSSPAHMAMVQQVSQAAQEAFDRHDWATAQAELQRLVAEAPQSAEARHRLGRVLLAQGRTAEAEAEFRRSLDLDKEYVDAIVALAQMALKAGRLVEALRLLDQAIELEPPRAEAHLSRGQTLEALGRPIDALAAYFRALESDPTLATASLRIATIQMGQNQLDQALVRLDDVLEIVPDDPEAHALRGRVHLALKQVEPAIDDLRFASEALIDQPQVFYDLAIALEAASRKGDALKAAEKAAKLAPEWVEARELSAKLQR